MSENEPTSEEHFEDQREDEGLRGRLEGLVPEIFKRTFYAGLGAVFTTEEGVRKLANEFSLPKDMANYLIQQAQSTKSEMFRIVAKEMRGFLEDLNLQDEMQDLLTSLSFEIKTEIRFIPNDKQKPRAKVKSSVAMKRKGKTIAQEEGESGGEDVEDVEDEEQGECALEGSEQGTRNKEQGRKNGGVKEDVSLDDE